MAAHNLSRQRNDLDRFVLIANAMGVSQRGIAKVLDVKPQAVQQRIKRSVEGMEK